MDELNKKMIYLKEYVEKNPEQIPILTDEDKKLLIKYYEELIHLKKNENLKLKNKLKKNNG